jgi:predicted permease
MWTHTLRPVFRRLRDDPGYAIAFILTLGLGIGASTAIFSAVQGVLIRDLPYPNADRIVYVEQPQTRAGGINANFSFVEVADYRSQAQAFEEVVEYGDWQFNVVGAGEPRLAYGGLVTSNYFKVLAIRPSLGRTLAADDDVDGAAPVAVLTYEFWRQAFGADPAVVGKVVELTGVATTIIGVLEPGSHYAGTERAALYANYSTNSHYMGASMQQERAHRMTDVYALIKRGVTIDAASGEVRAIADRLHPAYPADYPATQGFAIALTPWRDVLVKEARPTLLILMGAVALVLLVACANVGNLSLSRLVRRERELAVRAALGATPLQLRRQLLAEHLILALAGSAVGILVASLALGQLVSYAARLTLRSEEIQIDVAVLAFSLAVGIAVSVLFAWVPRLPAATAAAPALPSGGRATLSRSQRRMQRSLVAAQVAVSFVVLVGAGLLTRSLVKLTTTNTGVDTAPILALKAPNLTRFNPVQNRALFDNLTTRLAAHPGVESVALARFAPFDQQSLFPLRLQVEGGSPAIRPEAIQMLTNAVSDAYFKTLNVPILRGRNFTAEDTTGAPLAVVINEAMATLAFGHADPIGKRLQWSFNGTNWPGWRVVVGVARNVRELGPQLPPLPTVYESTRQASPGPTVLVRSSGDPTAAAGEAAKLVHEIDPKRPVTDIWTLESALGKHVAPSRVNATLFGAFALLALSIAAVGLGGVLAFAVSERTREFGIRMALGAEPNRILRRVLAEGVLLAAAGLVVGAMASLWLSRFVKGILFEIEPMDAASFAVAAGLLVLVATLASWLPARNATRVHPSEALRSN